VLRVYLFLQGILVGVLVAAPLGPLALWCVRYTLTQGCWYGLAAGLGAALGDAFYGAVASLGAGVVSGELVRYQTAFRLLGGLLLVFVGWRLWRTRLEGPVLWTAKRRTARGLLGAFLSTLALALSNPMTAVAFLGIFSALRLSASVSLVWGVLVGAWLWWVGLTLVVGGWRARLDVRTLVWVNRVAGVLMAGFGLLVWLSLVMS